MILVVSLAMVVATCAGPVLAASTPAAGLTDGVVAHAVTGVALPDQEPLPDDDRFEAAPLPPGTYEDLFVERVDPDWYAVEVPDGGTLSADVLFATADANLDLRLRDESGGLLESSSWSTRNESVTGTGLDGGTYLL